jgi:hypothetical protein
MSLIVEDGTGLANAESYGSVADADTYHANFGNLGWADFTTGEKESVLRKATQYIDITYGSRFPGYVVNTTQGLLWPRVWSVWESTSDGGGFFPTPISPALPIPVIRATFEAALRAAASDLLGDLDAPVLSTTVGPISVTYAEGSSGFKTYPLIDRIIGLVLSSGAATGMVERS